MLLATLFFLVAAILWDSLYEANHKGSTEVAAKLSLVALAICFCATLLSLLFLTTEPNEASSAVLLAAFENAPTCEVAEDAYSELEDWYRNRRTSEGASNILTFPFAQNEMPQNPVSQQEYYDKISEVCTRSTHHRKAIHMLLIAICFYLTALVARLLTRKSDGFGEMVTYVATSVGGICLVVFSATTGITILVSEAQTPDTALAFAALEDPDVTCEVATDAIETINAHYQHRSESKEASDSYTWPFFQTPESVNPLEEFEQMRILLEACT